MVSKAAILAVAGVLISGPVLAQTGGQAAAVPASRQDGVFIGQKTIQVKAGQKVRIRAVATNGMQAEVVLGEIVTGDGVKRTPISGAFGVGLLAEFTAPVDATVIISSDGRFTVMFLPNSPAGVGGLAAAPAVNPTLLYLAGGGVLGGVAIAVTTNDDTPPGPTPSPGPN